VDDSVDADLVPSAAVGWLPLPASPEDFGALSALSDFWSVSVLAGAASRSSAGDLLQLARHGGRDLGVDLVRGHLEEWLVDLDVVADLLEPAGHGALGDTLTQGRKRDLRSLAGIRGGIGVGRGVLGGGLGSVLRRCLLGFRFSRSLLRGRGVVRSPTT
jgi:hypothetical protein